MAFDMKRYDVPGDMLSSIANAMRDGLFPYVDGDEDKNELVFTSKTDKVSASIIRAALSAGLIFVPPSGDVTGATDTAAIAAAIAACAGTSKGIGFVDGDYYWNNTNDVTVGYSTSFEAIRTGLSPATQAGTVVVPPRFIGAGIYRTRHNMVVANKPMLRFYGSAAGVQLQSPFITGMTFRGPNRSGKFTSALQFGGVSTTYKNIIADPLIYSVGFLNFNTCTRHDDTTGATYDKCFFQNFMYGVDRGYNCDVFKFRACDFGDQSLESKITCTLNSTTAITTTGNLFKNVPTGATVCGTGIPAGTTITVVDGNNATLSAAATISGSITLYCFLGTAVVDSFTGYGTGWVPPYGAVGNSNILTFEDCWFLRIKMAVGAYHPTSSGIRFMNCYTELMWKLAELGNAGDAGCPSGFTVENTHFSQTESFMVKGVVDVLSAGATTGVVMKWVDNRSDAVNPSATKVPWIYAPVAYNSAASVEWDRNVLGTNNGVATVNVAGSAAYIPDKVRYVVGTGSGMQSGGYQRSLVASSMGTLNWDYGGEDEIYYYMDGNVTINNHGSQNPPRGRCLSFIFEDSGAGGKTITFGTKFLNASGAAIGTFTASTAGNRAVFIFKWDGAKYRQLNTAQWA